VRVTLKSRVRLGPAAAGSGDPDVAAVRAYLERVVDARVADVMHRCHLPAPRVGEMVRQGVLRLSVGLRRCEACRAPVATGTLCPACRARLAAPLVGIAAPDAEPETPMSPDEAAAQRAIAVVRALRHSGVGRPRAGRAVDDPDLSEQPTGPIPVIAVRAEPPADDPDAPPDVLARSRMWSRLRRSGAGRRGPGM
jgi:hypothetical protein